VVNSTFAAIGVRSEISLTETSQDSIP
jgi:hypothetical protein